MANNYVEFSEKIIISDAEVVWARDLLGLPKAILDMDESGDERVDLVDRWERIQEEFDIEDPIAGFGFSWDIDDPVSAGWDRDPILFISSKDEGVGDVEHVAKFFQKLLRKFPESERKVLTLQWSESCSKLRCGDFGGGAFAVTANDERWMTTGGWLKEQISSMAQKDEG